MKNTLIDQGLQQLNMGLENPVPQNLAYRIFVADVAKATTTWNSIKLAKMLGSKKFKPLTKQRKGIQVLSVGKKTPTKLYYFPILSYLIENGLKGTVSAIYKHVEANQVFTTVDLEYVGGTKTEPRWKVTVRWAKEELIAKGFIKRKSPRGVWEMTKAGEKWFLANLVRGN